MSHTPSSTSDRTDARAGQGSSNGAATVAILCGILGTIAGALSLMGMLTILMAIVGLVLGVAGLITGAQAWSSARHDTRTSNGAAIAGTLLGALAVILSVVSLADVATELDELDDAVTQLQQETDDLLEGDVGLEDADPDEITD